MVIALVIVTVSCLTDVLDGAMARSSAASATSSARCSTPPWTASPTAPSSASVACWLASRDQLRECAAALLCLLTGQVVSYVKARAEGLGMTANVGLAERTERLILVGIGGLLFGFDVKYGMEVGAVAAGAPVGDHHLAADVACVPAGPRHRRGGLLR